MKRKLIYSIIGAVVLISVLSYIPINIAKNALQKTIGEDSVFIAEESIDKIDRHIFSRIELIEIYSKDIIKEDLFNKSNDEFSKIQNVKSYIEKKDQQWKDAVKQKQVNHFMESIINNELSLELREEIALIDYFEKEYGYKVFGEIFVTNKYGVNAAQTGVTSDYYQADEVWWQKAKETGLYVEDVGYDESAKMHSLALCVRVDDENGDFKGVVKAVLNIEEIMEITKYLTLKEVHKGHGHAVHSTREYKLLTNDGKTIYSTEKYERLEKLSDAFLANLDKNNYFISEGDVLGEGDELFAHAHSEGYNNYKGLGWILVVKHETDEIFAPVKRLKNLLLLISSGIILLIILIGTLLFIFTSSTLKKLMSMATEIGKGNFDARLEINSKDEFGVLANTINSMAEKLSTLMRNEKKLKENERNKADEVARKNEEIAIMNEELQAANKEMFATNEALNSANKKLEKTTTELETSKAGLEKRVVQILNAVQEVAKGNFGVSCEVSGETTEFDALATGINMMVDDINNILKELRVSEDKFRSLVESAPNIIMIVDRGGLIQFANYVVPGIKKEDIIGQNHLDFVHSAFKDRVKNAIDNVFQTGLPGEYETEGVGSGNATSWYSTRVGPIKREEKVVEVVLIVSDITERIKTEKELKESNMELKEATVQLVQSEKMSALGELTAGVAHELNQPLNGMKIICQSILRDIQRGVPCDELNVGPELVDAVKEVDKMAAIIDHMRIFTRRTEGAMLDIVNINEIIEGSLKFTEQQLRDHNIVLIKDLDKNLPLVKGDAVRLEQVFMNLTSNARYALENAKIGDKKLEIKTATADISKISRERGGIPSAGLVSDSDSASSAVAIVVEIKDNGIGIPENILEKIFQPFFTTKEPGKGTGLGLSMAQRIVEEHKGRIEIESKEGEGTLFRVILKALTKD